MIKSEPDWAALPAGTPESLRNVLRLCLTKDLKGRARDIGDVSLAMRGAFETTGSSDPPRAGWRPSIAATAAALLVGAIIGGVVSRGVTSRGSAAAGLAILDSAAGRRLVDASGSRHGYFP